MNEDGKEFLIGMLIVFLAALLMTGIICYTVYEHRKINIDNFENTIKDLSDEQKCMHICGFQFGNFLEKYKFCLEKCDRISERDMRCGTE